MSRIWLAYSDSPCDFGLRMSLHAQRFYLAAESNAGGACTTAAATAPGLSALTRFPEYLAYNLS